jgi:uncharacterized protein (TIGR00369 family)
MDSFSEVWGRTSAVELLREMAAGNVPPPPHTLHIGLTIAAVETGRIEMVWLPTASLLNPGGVVHGGYVAMALDDAAGLSCATLGDHFRPMLTLGLRIDFVRPVRAGRRYRLIGEVAHTGGTRCIADARVLDGDKLMARASGSFVPNQSFDPERRS